MKLKSFEGLGDLYSKIASAEQQSPSVVTENANEAIVNTDTSIFLESFKSKGKVPVAGQAMGGNAEGGEGVVQEGEHEVSPLAPERGPSGLKGNNFKKLTKNEDPGSDKKTMKDRDDGTLPEDGNVHKNEGAKFTTSKQKIDESGTKNSKYNYKPKFTMSKPKFDQLYEEALNRIPFGENEDAPMGGDGAGVPSATDAAADAGTETDVPPGEEETEVTPEEAIESLKKVLSFLEKHHGQEAAPEDEMGAQDPEGGDAGHFGAAEEHAPIAEDIEAEDEGKPLTKVNGALKKGNPDGVSKPVTVGSLKAPGGKADKGKIQFKPEPEELSDGGLGENGKELQNVKKFTVKTSGPVSGGGKGAFDGS